MFVGEHISGVTKMYGPHITYVVIPIYVRTLDVLYWQAINYAYNRVPINPLDILKLGNMGRTF